jgi:carbamoyl-phosphate synthase large subunit
MAVAPICVLVTGVGGRSVGHQILHALLQVGDKYRIVATDADAFSFGLYQVENRYIVPRAGSPDYLAAIREIVERERIQVILPGTQPEVAILAEHRVSLADSGCLVIAGPSEVIRRCSNKRALSDWLVANGFDVPRAVPSARWRDLVAEAGFPVVGKPTEDTGGSRHVAILKNESEVEGYLAEMDRADTEVMIQEYVGSAEAEYTIGVLVSRGGSLIDSIALHRKLMGLSLGAERFIAGRRYALSTGYSQGTIVRHPLIQETCESLALRLGSRGPLNIQCRVAGDRVKVFEVHPRFSGTTSIRAEVGFNEPDILIRNYLFGEDAGRINYQSDVAAIRAFRSIIVPVATMWNVPRGGPHE